MGIRLTGTLPALLLLSLVGTSPLAAGCDNAARGDEGDKEAAEPAANDNPDAASENEPEGGASENEADDSVQGEGAPEETETAEAGKGPDEAETIPDVDAATEPNATRDGPLNKAAREIFLNSPEDPPTEHLYQVDEEFEGRHYIYGDEYNIHLFYPKIKDLGGGYIGVGADQAYIFAGWQKPDLAWMIDYDDWVTGIHQVYLTFFRHSDTPAEFLAWWGDEKEAEALALLEEEIGDRDDFHTIKTLFERQRNGTRARIRRLVKTFEEHDVPSVFHTQEQFDFVKNLIAEGRVRVMLANLLDKKGMKGIAESAEKLDVPIRVLYVSNAEEYWDFGDQYRENIRALPMDDTSVVLRTLSTWSRNEDYQYAVQGGQQYQGWLGAGWVVRVSYIVQRQPVEDPTVFELIETKQTIEEATERRKARKQRQRERREKEKNQENQNKNP